MTTDYDDIGADYLLIKSIPWKHYSERHSFFQAVGPVVDKRVLDVACGDGFYSRHFRQAGAKEVVGIDISAEMIRLAQQKEKERPLEITYVVGDAGDLKTLLKDNHIPPFDFAVSAWLFDYAISRDQLQAMCQSFADAMMPGGRLIHVGGCFSSLFEHPESFGRFGVDLEILEDIGDGSRIKWTVKQGEKSISAENTMWTPPTISKELERAGFEQIHWPQPSVSEEGIQAKGHDYWTDFFAHPYFAVTTAVRK